MILEEFERVAIRDNKEDPGFSKQKLNINPYPCINYSCFVPVVKWPKNVGVFW